MCNFGIFKFMRFRLCTCELLFVNGTRGRCLWYSKYHCLDYAYSWKNICMC